MSVRFSIRVPFVFLLSILSLSWTTVSHSATRCEGGVAESDVAVAKAQYLALSKDQKIHFLKKAFCLDDRSAGLGYYNLEVTPVFKIFGDISQEISTKNLYAAKAVLKQYEIDSRENAMTVQVMVLYEPASFNKISNTDSPWAVLIVRRTSDRSGRMRFHPVALYSIESGHAGQTARLLTNQFQSLIM